jgi:hypothetical protein
MILRTAVSLTTPRLVRVPDVAAGGADAAVAVALVVVATDAVVVAAVADVKLLTTTSVDLVIAEMSITRTMTLTTHSI